jgi:type VI secretion system Hcp family effector
MFVAIEFVKGNPASLGLSELHGMSLGSKVLTPLNIIPVIIAQNRSGGSSSGVSAGRRVHQPFKVIKEIDTTSPTFYQAATTGEKGSKVKLHLYTSSLQPRSWPSLIITLGNASVTGVHRGHLPAKNTHESEEVEFTFQKIEYTLNDGGATASDNWGART